MTVKITPNDRGNPPGKLADAELHFSDGPLEGLKLIGFSIWERRGGSGRNVTFPARQYSINGERRSFAFRSRQQLPVAHRRPPTLVCRSHGVSGQRVPQRDGPALVEQDRHRLGRRPAQPSGGRQTVFSVGEDGQDLIARDAGEPLQEVVDGG